MLGHIESESENYPAERAISINGGSPVDAADAFNAFSDKVKEAEYKHKPVTFAEYFKDVIAKMELAQAARKALRNGSISAGEQRYLEKDSLYDPSPHPADILYRAITSYPVEIDEAGRRQYHFFTKRDDRFAVYGSTYQLGLLVDAIRNKTGRVPGYGRAILLQAPTGAGKSTIIDGLEAGFEEYTNSKETIYTIQGCQYQCNPLSALPIEARKEFAARYNIHIEQDLCPHCQQKVGSAKSLFDVPVVPVQFSVAQGVGIVRVQQEATVDFANPNERDVSLDRMLRANNGILEIHELFKHPFSFLKTVMDINRERRIQLKGITYHPRFVILTHATRDDFKRFEALVSEKKAEFDLRAFEQRFYIIHIPYMTSQTDIIMFYGKAFRQADLHPHISPQTFERASMIELASRLTKSNIPNVDIDTKVRIYRGENTGKVTQKDRERIEAEGRDNKEGLDGLSPVQMIELLSLSLKENPQCINPVRTLREIETFIKQQPFDYPRKVELLTTINNQLTIYAAWLEKAVKRAFRGDYEEACEKLFQEYLDQVDLYALSEKVLDPHTGEYVGADEKFLGNVEFFLGISENAKREFREKLSMRVLEKARNRNVKEEPLSYSEFDDIKEGLEKMVTGESEQDINAIILSLLGMPHEKRITLEVPDEKKRKRLEEAKNALIEKYGFCRHCAPEMIVYTVHTVHKK